MPMLISAALLLAAGAAQAQTPPEGPEVSVPFATRGQARTFEPDRNGRGLYIQNLRRDWFYARFFTRCDDLSFAARIGFQTFGGTSTLSRGDTILAGRERCRIASIVASGPPPKKTKKPRQG